MTSLRLPLVSVTATEMRVGVGDQVVFGAGLASGRPASARTVPLRGARTRRSWNALRHRQSRHDRSFRTGRPFPNWFSLIWTDLTFTLSHNVPHTTSSEIIRNVVFDRAKGVFQGKILVAQDADDAGRQSGGQHEGLVELRNGGTRRHRRTHDSTHVAPN